MRFNLSSSSTSTAPTAGKKEIKVKSATVSSTSAATTAATTTPAVDTATSAPVPSVSASAGAT